MAADGGADARPAVDVVDGALRAQQLLGALRLPGGRVAHETRVQFAFGTDALVHPASVRSSALHHRIRFGDAAEGPFPRSPLALSFLIPSRLIGL